MLNNIVSAQEIHILKKRNQGLLICSMKRGAIPSNSTYIVNLMVRYSYLYINKSVFGSIVRTGCRFCISINFIDCLI